MSKIPGQDKPAEQIAVRKLSSKARLIMSLAIVGMLICGITGKDLDRLSFAKDWRLVKGVILHSSIVRSRMMKFPYTSDVHPEFVYQYQVDNQPYENRDVSFDKADDASVGKIVLKYPTGSKIDVYYQAAEPSTSYFDHEGGNNHSPYSPNNILFLLGAGMIIASLIMSVRLQKQTRAERETQALTGKI
jgi:Protein of unknown function (DUF3592)